MQARSRVSPGSSPPHSQIWGYARLLRFSIRVSRHDPLGAHAWIFPRRAARRVAIDAGLKAERSESTGRWRPRGVCRTDRFPGDWQEANAPRRRRGAAVVPGCRRFSYPRTPARHVLAGQSLWRKSSTMPVAVRWLSSRRIKSSTVGATPPIFFWKLPRRTKRHFP